MADLDNHKSAVRGSLEPLNTDGRLPITHSVINVNNDLILTPPILDKLLCLSVMALSIATFILSSYMLFIVGDFFWTFALLVGGTLLAGLGMLLKNTIKQYAFIHAEQSVIGFSDVINFNDIDCIEVIKKSVTNKFYGAPFQSKEVRLLTRLNKRYLLLEGTDSEKINLQAALIANYLNVPLVQGKTPHSDY